MLYIIWCMFVNFYVILSALQLIKICILFNKHWTIIIIQFEINSLLNRVKFKAQLKKKWTSSSTWFLQYKEHFFLSIYFFFPLLNWELVKVRFPGRKSLQFWGYRAYFGGKKPSAEGKWACCGTLQTLYPLCSTPGFP
jgi:hypothetical protein